MKKEYITPQFEVFEYESQLSILADSLPSFIDPPSVGSVAPELEDEDISSDREIFWSRLD